MVSTGASGNALWGVLTIVAALIIVIVANEVLDRRRRKWALDMAAGDCMTFREVRYASTGIRVAVVLIGVAVAVHTLISAWPGTTSDTERFLFAILSAAVVGLCLLVARMSSVTEVTVAGVELRFRLGITIWRRHIPRDDLSIDGVERVGVVRAGGLGLRYLGGGRTVLTVSPGPGVVLRTRGGERTYVVGSDRADELVDALSPHR
ncbi:hypothetical protein GC089_03505 [Cellulomonas sp. JZ18]|uniref:hypothetical protein n=1 Tax=Cellulomonas sp. JZ18 TaxID=2654191 RepID=UPI0012D45E4C|nr:hypothetical protein [Cellulomonas sp. JZ18]QGQ18490.1 hypothetical protein GC089_03505 [Cellulomonas sp. JZ18]